jgi:hypothetical protein
VERQEEALTNRPTETELDDDYSNAITGEGEIKKERRT